MISNHDASSFTECISVCQVDMFDAKAESRCMALVFALGFGTLGMQSLDLHGSAFLRAIMLTGD